MKEYYSERKFWFITISVSLLLQILVCFFVIPWLYTLFGGTSPISVYISAVIATAGGLITCIASDHNTLIETLGCPTKKDCLFPIGMSLLMAVCATLILVFIWATIVALKHIFIGVFVIALIIGALTSN